MTSQQRVDLAKQTLAICQAGKYVTQRGVSVDIQDMLVPAMAGTRLFRPMGTLLFRGGGRFSTRFSVTRETTLKALSRMVGEERSELACLNFASAKHPGGGFLRGTLAQEESLAYASGLYPCLTRVPEYYDENRRNGSALYLDLTIFSPKVPFFRDDAGVLLEKPFAASVITTPAPNVGALLQNESEKIPLVHDALRFRAEFVLHVARSRFIERLILGAWGCGVFRNDPQQIANVFGELLLPGGSYSGVFRDVVFAIPGDGTNFEPFAVIFQQ